MFALVIRGAVIAVIIVPYVYMSLSGLHAATRSLGNDRTRAVAVFLVIAHLVLLIPPGTILFLMAFGAGGRGMFAV